MVEVDSKGCWCDVCNAQWCVDWLSVVRAEDAVAGFGMNK
jgi:hypothetical protein